MPILKSALKKLRSDQRRTRENRRLKLIFKTAVKTAHKKPLLKNLSEAFRYLDRAAKKKVIHKNKASRLKARLAKRLIKK